MAEHPAHNRLVPGSNPGGPTTNQPVVNIALFTPEIPHNTGNIIRLCANVGATLHLIGPLGFDLYHPKLRRAALDYRDLANVITYESWACFTKTHPLGSRTFATAPVTRTPYTEPSYQRGDTVLFGPEGAGLPNEILSQFPLQNRIHIPMLSTTRSLNLSNAAAIITYEMWKQMGFAGVEIDDMVPKRDFS